jgi:AcrR family transcriptional regulator
VSPVSATSTETADDIRKAALRLFARNGYDATSMREIAGAVGIQAGSLYNHFPSKEEILWDLTRGALLDLQGKVGRALEALPADATPRDRLVAFIDAHVRFHAINSEKARLVNRQMPGLDKCHYREVVTLRHTFEDRLGEILGDGVSRGDFVLVDERITVYAILQMSIAVSTWYRRGGDLSVEDVSALYVDLALRMVMRPSDTGAGPA